MLELKCFIEVCFNISSCWIWRQGVRTWRCHGNVTLIVSSSVSGLLQSRLKPCTIWKLLFQMYFSARRRKTAWGVCLYKTLGLVLSVQSTHAVISGLLDSEFYRPLFSWMAFKDTNSSLKSKLLVLIDLITSFQLEHFSSSLYKNVFRSVCDWQTPAN